LFFYRKEMQLLQNRGGGSSLWACMHQPAKLLAVPLLLDLPHHTLVCRGMFMHDSSIRRGDSDPEVDLIHLLM
jgi:hypothetical protein